MTQFPLLIYCADIGSIRRRRFAWARLDLRESQTASDTDIRALASAVAKDLNEGRSVALGFECPCYVPLPDEPDQLTSARIGEGNRAWCAGAGSGALAVGLSQTTWILREIRFSLRGVCGAFVEWESFRSAPGGLFVWEAFVSGAAKGKSHTEDAEAAVRAFQAALPEPRTALRDISVFSLLGAALLHTGWSEDKRLLFVPCLVVQARPRA